MALVPKENEACWSWFLKYLKNALSCDRILTFLSDRHWGLLLSVPNFFPNSHHSYCLHHMQNNIASIVKSGRALWVAHLLERCALASNCYEFEKAMSKYKEIRGAKAIEYLNDKPYDH